MQRISLPEADFQLQTVLEEAFPAAVPHWWDAMICVMVDVS